MVWLAVEQVSALPRPKQLRAGGIRGARSESSHDGRYWLCHPGNGCDNDNDNGNERNRKAAEESSPPSTTALSGRIGGVAVEAGGIVLYNDFIELGLVTNQDFIEEHLAKFGIQGGITEVPLFGRRPGVQNPGIGMLYDYNGFDHETDLRVDISLPGSPEETFNLAWGDTTYSNARDEFFSQEFAGPTANSDSASVTSTSTRPGEVEVVQTHKLLRDKRYFVTTVTITNLGGETINNVKFARSVDPDNTRDMGGTTSTLNVIVSQAAESGVSAVAAIAPREESLGSGRISTRGRDGGYTTLSGGLQSTVMYYSIEPNSRVATYGFGIRDIHESNSGSGIQFQPIPDQAAGFERYADQAILIAHEWDSLGAGESVCFSYATVLSAGEVEDIVDEIDNSDLTSNCDAPCTYTWQDPETGCCRFGDSLGEPSVFDGVAKRRGECRRLCDDTDGCQAIEWYGRQEVCELHMATPDGVTSPTDSDAPYICRNSNCQVKTCI